MGHVARPHGASLEGMGWSLLEAAPEAIFIAGIDLVLLRANRRAERLFGYDRHELVGMALRELLPDEGDARPAPEFVPEASGRFPALPASGRAGDRVGRRRDGRLFPAEVSQSVHEAAGATFHIVLVRDVSERRRLETQLRRMSTRDSLTGLYNRAFFELEQNRLERTGTFPCSVIVADVDGLKPVNDHVGHAAGDALLRRAAVVLRGAFRDADVVARTGGDEFVVLLPGLGSHDLGLAIARIRSDLARHNEMHEGQELGLSVGGATAYARGELAQALIAADREMYEDKRAHPERSSGVELCSAVTRRSESRG